MSRRVELDVREVPPPERHARIFQTFESLAEEDEMLLVVDHDPKPLLYQFQAERGGCYDWSALEEGPLVWRILIARRGASDRHAKSAASYLGWDHDRLEALLCEHVEAFTAGRLEEARQRFAEFRTGLKRHIRMEEQVLFPAFDRATGMEGPTAVMRQEHRTIEGTLDRMLVRDGQFSGGGRPSRDAATRAAERPERAQ
jgi:uncharacterized protein (DUF2249 family)